MIGEALELRHLAPVAAKVGPVVIDQLVAEAIARFMLALDAERQDPVQDRRHFDIDTDHVSFDGTLHCEGELEIPDVYALDAAVKDEMARLGRVTRWSRPGRSPLS